MRVVVLLFIIGVGCAVCSSVPSESPDMTKTQNAIILRYHNDNIGLGDYNFAYEQSDGTKHQQQGKLIKKDSSESLAVKGSFTFIGPDGVIYTVTYIADDNGFKPDTEDDQGIRG